MGFFHSEIERLFYADIREKKKTGSGAFHQKGKGVRHTMHGIKTPYDFMKAKEKRLLNGEVQVSNMYETILMQKEFLTKDEEMQRTLINRWREIYPNTKIIEEMGMTQGSYYKMLKELGIQTTPKGGAITRKNSRRAQVIPAAAIPAKSNGMTPETNSEHYHTITNIQPEQSMQQLIKRGLYLEYHGTYTAEQLTKILTKLQLLVEGEQSKFKVFFSIQEEE